ncbi:hypothetical protein B0H13DRAFT_1851281 [Mycena leptocephala]|nr:hypothetical protein B0H13DRAFT_1851281 [Mycena leptocephala]
MARGIFTLRHLDSDDLDPSESAEFEALWVIVVPKPLLSGEYCGPDIIGQTGLINMELTLQFPALGHDTHKVAWRQKGAEVTGVKADWGPGVQYDAHYCLFACIFATILTAAGFFTGSTRGDLAKVHNAASAVSAI